MSKVDLLAILPYFVSFVMEELKVTVDNHHANNNHDHVNHHPYDYHVYDHNSNHHIYDDDHHLVLRNYYREVEGVCSTFCLRLEAKPIGLNIADGGNF